MRRWKGRDQSDFLIGMQTLWGWARCWRSWFYFLRNGYRHHSKCLFNTDLLSTIYLTQFKQGGSCWGCHNKKPQAQTDFLTILEARSVSQGGIGLGFFSSAGGHLSVSSHGIFLCVVSPEFPCVSKFPPLTRTPVPIGWGPVLGPHFNLIISLKVRSSNVLRSA